MRDPYVTDLAAARDCCGICVPPPPPIHDAFIEVDLIERLFYVTGAVFGQVIGSTASSNGQVSSWYTGPFYSGPIVPPLIAIEFCTLTNTYDTSTGISTSSSACDASGQSSDEFLNGLMQQAFQDAISP